MKLNLDQQQIITLVRCANELFSQRCNDDQILEGLPDLAITHSHIERALLNGNINAAQQNIQLNKMQFPALIVDKNNELYLINKHNETLQLLFTNAQEPTTELSNLSCQLSWLISVHEVIDKRTTSIHSKIPSWLKPVIDEVKPFYGSLLLGSFTVNLLAVVIPLFTMNVYDRVVPNAATDTLWVLALGAFLAIVFDWFLKQARTQLTDTAGQQIDLKVSSTLFSRVIGMRLEHRPESAGAYAKQVQDFDSVREFLTSATLVSAIDLPFTIMFLALIAWLGGLIVLIPITTMLLIVLIGAFLQGRLTHSVEEAAKLSTQRQAYLIEYLNQIVELKQSRSEQKAQRTWEQTMAQLSLWQNKSRHSANTLSHSVTTLQQVTTIGLIVAGVYLIQAGEVSMGALIAMVMISGRAGGAVSQIASLLLKYKQTESAIDSVKAVLELPQESQQSVLNNYSDISGDIRVKQLTFNYPEQQLAVLKNISLSIERGQKIGIYGVAGSGKSSLLALLAGQYEATRGQIFYDDIEIKQWSLKTIRRNTGWMAQTPQLFYGSLLENITVGAHNVDPNELARAIKMAGIHHFMERLESGLESQVGEFGRCLSGGQRQAVMLARALLQRPKLLLLDEPTSAMDEISERHIISSLKSIDDTTMIIASHKAAVLSMCDKIVVLENGELRDIQTPQQLFSGSNRRLRSIKVTPKGDSQ